MKKKILLLLASLIGLNAFAQDLTCNDFKNGTFTASMTEPIEMNWKIIREGNNQTEIITKLPNELKEADYPTYLPNGIITWNDDCSYIITYDGSKIELTETQKMVNSVGGVLTELIKIERNCFYYKCTLNLKESEQTLYGVLCKE